MTTTETRRILLAAAALDQHLIECDCCPNADRHRYRLAGALEPLERDLREAEARAPELGVHRAG